MKSTKRAERRFHSRRTMHKNVKLLIAGSTNIDLAMEKFDSDFVLRMIKNGPRDAFDRSWFSNGGTLPQVQRAELNALEQMREAKLLPVPQRPIPQSHNSKLPKGWNVIEGGLEESPEELYDLIDSDYGEAA